MTRNDERDWRHSLEHLSEGDDQVARAAAEELEAATLRKPPWRSDVKSAFMETPDGALVDKSELVARSRPPYNPPAG